MRTFFVISIVIILSACGAVPKKSEVMPTSFKFDSRSYISDYCLLSEDKPPKASAAGPVAIIASIVVPALVEYAITGIAKNLQEIEYEETTARSDFYLYQYDLPDPKDGAIDRPQYPKFNGHFGCITTITGNFVSGDQGAARAGGIVKQWQLAENAIDFDQPKAEEEILKRLKANQIYLSGELNGLYSIYEVKLEKSEDESAIRIDNRYLNIRNLLKNKKKVGMSYTFSITGPGTTPNSKVYATIPIDFGEVVPGTVLYGEKFKMKQTGWVTKPGMTAASLSHFIHRDYGKLTTCSGPEAMCGPREYMPVQLVVKNTQTKKPGEISKLIGQILEGSKDSLVESFKGEFFPDEEAISAAQTDATIAVLTAAAAIEDAGDNTTKRELANAQLNKACKALKSAGGAHTKCE